MTEDQDTEARESAFLTWREVLVFSVMLLCAAIAGCGGNSGPEDDGRATALPVDCSASAACD